MGAQEPWPSWWLRPHGTEAAAKRHRRADERPCGACLAGEAEAKRVRAGIFRSKSEAQSDVWERRRRGELPARRAPG